jgi:hypothetical protein
VTRNGREKNKKNLNEASFGPELDPDWVETNVAKLNIVQFCDTINATGGLEVSRPFDLQPAMLLSFSARSGGEMWDPFLFRK